MAISKDQIRDLLGSGLSNDIVATAVGCDPSYISQLLSDPEFADAVTTLRMQSLTAANKRDATVDGIEDKILKRLDDAVSSNLIYKPQDLLRAFQVVNAAKRRGVPAHENVTINNKIVNLNIPTKVIQNFTIDARGEVVEVEGQTMVTMPAHQLLNSLASEKGNDGDKYRKVAAYLPGAGAITSGSSGFSE